MCASFLPNKCSPSGYDVFFFCDFVPALVFLFFVIKFFALFSPFKSQIINTIMEMFIAINRIKNYLQTCAIDFENPMHLCNAYPNRETCSVCHTHCSMPAVMCAQKHWKFHPFAHIWLYHQNVIVLDFTVCTPFDPFDSPFSITLFLSLDKLWAKLMFLIAIKWPGWTASSRIVYAYRYGVILKSVHKSMARFMNRKFGDCKPIWKWIFQHIIIRGFMCKIVKR